MSCPFDCCWMDSICYADQDEDKSRRKSESFVIEKEDESDSTPITILQKGSFIDTLLKSFKNIKVCSVHSDKNGVGKTKKNVDSSSNTSGTMSCSEESFAEIIISNDILPDTPSTITSYTETASNCTRNSSSLTSISCTSLNKSTSWSRLEQDISFGINSIRRQISLDLSPIPSASSSCCSIKSQKMKTLNESVNCDKENTMNVNATKTTSDGIPIPIIHVQNDLEEDHHLNSPIVSKYISPTSSSRFNFKARTNPLSPTNTKQRQEQVKEQRNGTTDEVQILLQEPPRLNRVLPPDGFLLFDIEENGGIELIHSEDESDEIELLISNDEEENDSEGISISEEISISNDEVDTQSEKQKNLSLMEDDDCEELIVGISFDLEEEEFKLEQYHSLHNDNNLSPGAHSTIQRRSYEEEEEEEGSEIIGHVLLLVDDDEVP